MREGDNGIVYEGLLDFDIVETNLNDLPSIETY